MSIIFRCGIAAGLALIASGQTVGFLTKNCAGCHNDKLKSGGISLAKFDSAKSSELTEKIIRQVRNGLMPPAVSPQPSTADRNAFVRGLQATVDRVYSLHPDPGAPPLHRLNRTEYANSIRNLLSLDIDSAALLPTDDLTRGFDNMAEALTISPTLVEAYVRAAGKISRQAIGDTEVSRQHATYTLPRVISQTRQVEGAPFGTRGGISVVHNFPASGEYVFRMTFYFHQMGTTLFGRSMGKGQQIEVSINGERKAVFDVNPLMKQNEELRTPPIPVPAGPQRVSAAFIQSFYGPVEDLVSPVEQSLVDVNVSSVPGLTSLPHLHDLIIDGPQSTAAVIAETPSRKRIFGGCTKQDLRCAKQIISNLARQAYRRPINDGDVERLLNHYQRGYNEGGFEAGIQAALQSILSNPEFLFRLEKQPAQAATNYRISGLELASRLSYFLWSSAPDDQLLTAAGKGQLQTPSGLEAQVRRMLADPRAEALATNFAGQWLTLQNLKEVLPDPLMFPNFDRNLARSMRRETELLFLDMIQSDRTPVDLLTSPYTFVDERLAKHYGIPNVLGNRFRKVNVAQDYRRGLFGHGSILTLTSVANRTAPVNRGKWVLEVLLGTPPPPPPPNIPALKEAVDGEKTASVRVRLQQHRDNPACASCHRLIDPIGFALENFDAVGVWRNKDGGLPIDATSVFYDGTKLDGPVSLRNVIVQHSDAYLETFAERLLSYGMGRVTRSADMPAVRGITRDAAKQNNRFSAFVLAVVKSAPFQWRRSESLTAGPSGEE
jgi:hypothetical protein